MNDTTLWGLLTEAGWTMVPLYLCSLAALAVTLRKLLEFRLHGVGRSDALVALESPGADLPASTELAATPLGSVLQTAAKHRASGPVEAEAAAQRTALAELDRFEAWLPLLAYIAQVAPLFGLLGTVIGMVELFSSMEAAGDAVSTTTLSSGIWKALLTTAAGLIVAIPTLGAHLWLTRVLEGLQRRMERGVGQLLSGGAS